MTPSASIPDAAVRRLSQLLHERVGLRPAPENEMGLRLALSARLSALGDVDPATYVARLEAGDEPELRQLLPLVTVGKTDFFRDSNQFRALRTRVIPELLNRARQAMRPLRIWSAGCATGEEPYSLAMLAAELQIEPDGIDLLATDVNPRAVEQAARGEFQARRLSTVPPEYLRRHFASSADGFVARPELKQYLRFEVHNLAGGVYPLPRDGDRWDLILCRNVIIYFDKVTTARVVARFRDLLVERGYLCLGYSESLYRISNAFELVEVEGSFLYTRPDGPRPRLSSRPEAAMQQLQQVLEARATPARQPAPAKLPQRPTPPALRVLESAPTPAPAPAPRSSEAMASADPVMLAAALLDRGEFEHAIDLVGHALERSAGNLSLQITLGNLLTVVGRQADARAAYLSALSAEPLCAEAHMFLGVACYEAGAAYDLDAMQALTRALFLDPNLPLAHYYSGRLAERRGDLAAARRAYRNAVSACKAQQDRPPLLSYFPDLPTDPAVLARAAQYALAAVEES